MDPLCLRPAPREVPAASVDYRLHRCPDNRAGRPWVDKQEDPLLGSSSRYAVLNDACQARYTRIFILREHRKKEKLVTKIKATNITWHEGHVSRDEREKVLDQKGALIWLTGLSGSGKSTIAFTLEHALVQRGHLCYVLDGDNIRHGLNKNLGFSAEDRAENIRRIGEVGRLFVDAGIVTITSFISPYREDRQLARQTVGDDSFFEVFCDAPLSVCEQRDPKGLYKKARAGEIKGFTGIDDPYEPPDSPEWVIDTSTVTPQEAAVQLCELLEKAGKIPPLTE